MKTVQAVGASLIAALAISAVTVTSASAAAPEVGRCVKSTPKAGGYTSAACVATDTEDNDGTYEWKPGVVKGKFKTTGGVGALETLNGTGVGCNTEESGGEYSSPKTVTGVTIRFTGCHSTGLVCETEGAAEGEIVTMPTEGKIGWENKLKKKVAMDLFPTEADKGLYVTFNCPPTLHMTVGGSVLVPVTPVDKMASELTLKYVGTKGKQKPEKFEGEPKDVLITTINTKAPEQSGITITSKAKGEESLELNAVL